LGFPCGTALIYPNKPMCATHCSYGVLLKLFLGPGRGPDRPGGGPRTKWVMGYEYRPSPSSSLSVFIHTRIYNSPVYARSSSLYGGLASPGASGAVRGSSPPTLCLASPPTMPTANTEMLTLLVISMYRIGLQELLLNP